MVVIKQLYGILFDVLILLEKLLRQTVFRAVLLTLAQRIFHVSLHAHSAPLLDFRSLAIRQLVWDALIVIYVVVGEVV